MALGAKLFDKSFDADRNAVYNRRVAIRENRDSQSLLRVSAVTFHEVHDA
jgi:hypothetical protein